MNSQWKDLFEDQNSSSTNGSQFKFSFDDEEEEEEGEAFNQKAFNEKYNGIDQFSSNIDLPLFKQVSERYKETGIKKLQYDHTK